MFGGDRARAADELTQRASRANIPGGKEKLSAMADKVRAGHDPRGVLYKADLPDEWLPKMLDWDKPLSQQPESVKKVANQIYGPQLKTRPIGKDLVDVHLYENGGGSIGAFPPSKVADVLKNPADYLPFTGQAFHRQLTDMGAKRDLMGRPYTPDADVARNLREAGIPGIRYKDQGSRGTEGGTHNYVVFPGMEDKLKILERK
jgi:hypothetical protein